jgi:integrase
VSAEIPRINWHSLRHIRASLLLLKGAPVAFASQRLGHANPSVTYSGYSHVVDGMQDAYVSKIDEWMTPAQKGV